MGSALNEEQENPKLKKEGKVQSLKKTQAVETVAARYKI